MQIFMTIFIALFCLAVGVYTGSFGYWVWQKKNYRGAIGVFLLAMAAVIVPMLLWFSSLYP